MTEKDTSMTSNEVSVESALTQAKETVADQSAASREKAPPRKAARLSILGVLAFLLSLCALLASGFVWYENQRVAQSKTVSVEVLSQGLAAEAANSKRLAESVSAAEKLILQTERRFTASLDNVENKLTSQKRFLQSMTNTDRNDWLLAEVEHLLRLANQRLTMGRQLDGALPLLQSADEIIKDIDDTDLYKTRTALASDIAVLRTTAKVDVEGLYASLSAVSKQLNDLRLFSLPVFDVTESPEEQLNNEQLSEKIKSGFAKAWGKASSFIRISRQDENFKPELAPDLELALRQSSRMMIEQAQLALLSGNQSLYDRSLEKVQAWLNQYYKMDDESTRAVLGIIEELARETITQEIPDISSSLKTFKRYMVNRRVFKHDSKSNNTGVEPKPENSGADK